MTGTITPGQPESVTPPAPAATPDVTDIDELELQQAKDAAKAEESAANAPQGEQTPAATAAEPPKEPEAPTEAKAPEVPMIPKPRFDELGQQRDRALQDAAYWRGVAEGRQGQPAGKSGETIPPAPPAPTLEQRRAEIGTKIEALAKQFDDGEITMSDFKRQERELIATEDVLREEALLTKIRPAPTPQQPAQNDELYLETLTAQLETDHPWVGVFDQVGTEAQWRFLRDQAVENLKTRGIDSSSGNVGKYELRKEMSQLAEQLGPAMVGTAAKAKGIALPGQTSGAPAAPSPQPQKPPLSEAAQQRATKLGLATTAPPNLSAMTGQTGDPSGMPSEAALEGMTDDDIGNLPNAVRNKLRGIAA